MNIKYRDAQKKDCSKVADILIMLQMEYLISFLKVLLVV